MLTAAVHEQVNVGACVVCVRVCVTRARVCVCVCVCVCVWVSSAGAALEQKNVHK